MREFLPTDDELEVIEADGEAKRTLRRRHNADQQRTAEARAQANIDRMTEQAGIEAKVEEIRLQAVAAGFPKARALFIPTPQREARKKAKIDVSQKVHEMRFWDGFQPICEADVDAAFAAAEEMVEERGSFSAWLDDCTPETKSRWEKVSAAFSESPTSTSLNLVRRGLAAIRSEAGYRRGLVARAA